MLPKQWFGNRVQILQVALVIYGLAGQVSGVPLWVSRSAGIALVGAAISMLFLAMRETKIDSRKKRRVEAVSLLQRAHQLTADYIIYTMNWPSSPAVLDPFSNAWRPPITNPMPSREEQTIMKWDASLHELFDDLLRFATHTPLEAVLRNLSITGAIATGPNRLRTQKPTRTSDGLKFEESNNQIMFLARCLFDLETILISEVGRLEGESSAAK